MRGLGRILFCLWLGIGVGALAQPKPERDPRKRLIQFFIPPWVNVEGRTNGRGGQENGEATDVPDPGAASSINDLLGRMLGKDKEKGSGAQGTGAGGGGSAETANGAGAGAGAGDGGAGDNVRIGFDENANGGGPGAPGGASIAYPLWYPMCLFMDVSVVPEAQANATIKGMVDAMAKCNVNLVVFPVAVRPGSYPSNPEGSETVNKLQTQWCNITGNVDNAQRASTSMCVNNDRMADHMCGGQRELDTRTAGCAQLNSSPEEKARVALELERLRTSRDQADRARYEEIMKDKEGKGGGGSSPVAPSIEDTGSCTARIVSHEAIGHSMIGHPNGESDGHDIGIHKKGGADGWTAEGCAAIRRNAFANSGRWRYNPSQTTYYAQPPDELLFDLTNGYPLFSPQQPPPPGGPPRILPPVGPPKRIVFDDDFFDKKTPKQQAPPPSQGAPPQLAATPAEARHRRRPGLATLIASASAGKNTYQGQPPERTPGNPAKAKPAPPGPPGKGGPRIGFDDEAPKNLAGVGSAVGKIKKEIVEAPPGESELRSSYQVAAESGKGGEARLGYDDEAPKGGLPIAAVGAAGGGNKSVGYDDTAPKGGYGAVGLVSGARGPASEAVTSGTSGGKYFPLLAAPVKLGSSPLDGNFFQQLGEVPEEETELRRRRSLGGALRQLEPGGPRVRPYNGSLLQKGR